MKNNKGFSMIVLVITIIVIIVLSAMTIVLSNKPIEQSATAKEEAEKTIDDDKINEIMTYELAGTYELIDVDIDFMRITLTDSIQVIYEGKTYGNGYALYIAERDIDKVADALSLDGLKPFKELTRSYVADSSTGKFVRLKNDWSISSL